MSTRIVPTPFPIDQRLPIIIDTDAANEIDDLYAVALAIACPERFDIRGFVATHYAAKAGPESTQLSYDVMVELLDAAGAPNRYPLKRGSHPMRYPNTPEDSEGVQLIIDTARQCTPEAPLWVVALGAASNLASALLLAPDIFERVRFLFHGRSEDSWPTHSRQFNIQGDIIATQTLLASSVPLAWFDTGTKLYADMATTERRLAPIGRVGRYLHDYRFRSKYFQGSEKGFFDLGDIAWLVDPSLCVAQEIDAPEMTRWMEFRQTAKFGRMLHVGSIQPAPTWELFYRRLEQHFLR